MMVEPRGAAAVPAAPLERYVPGILTGWDADAPGQRWQPVDGTLCFVDISGFTKLSEKLARRGPIGAEELTDVLNRVFGEMLRRSRDRGGALLKFGGDALLLLFSTGDHALQASCAAVEMRAALRQAAQVPTSAGRIRLRMSVGLHSGVVDLFRVGTSHQELIVTGDAATVTATMEHAASAGQILVSSATRDLLPAGAAPIPCGPGHLLGWRRAVSPPSGAIPHRVGSAASVETCVPVALRDHLADARTESEHRVASVGFVRFGGIEERLAAAGHRQVADDLHDLITTIQECVDREGVTFLATDLDADGGKIILASGAPRTQEDDAGRMLRAVRRIADAELSFPLQIGVHRDHLFTADIGTSFRSTYTGMGDTVNLAARLMAAAPPGAVYASPTALDDSRTLFEVHPLEPFSVKGKTAPVHAFAVGTETGVRARRSRQLPFTGREQELEALRAELARTGPDRGAVVTLIGEAGIGKSRLLAEALAAAPSRRQLTVRAEPNGADLSYWAFRDPVRNVLGIALDTQTAMAEAMTRAVRELDENLLPVLPLIGDVVNVDVPETALTRSLEPRFRPDRTAGVIVDLLDRALDGPVALVVEDAHWLDEASAALLLRLTEAATHRAWSLLVTRRPAEDHDAVALGRAMVLGPLLDADVRALATAATSATPLRNEELDEIVARADGNPLFLEEVLHLVRSTGSTESIPNSLEAVVGAQIDALRPFTRQVLRYTSVLGVGFRRTVVNELMAERGIGVDDATLTELARFLVRDGDERWRFRHPVAQQVAYHGLSYRRRGELHLAAGNVIERLAGPDTDPVAGVLAMQFSHAGRPDRAWPYALVAGRRAKAAYANVEAAGHFERALDAARHLPDVDPAAQAEVLVALGDVSELAGRFERSLDAYRSASHLSSDPLYRAELLLKRARIRMHLGAYRSALGEATRGLHVVASLDTTAARRIRARLRALQALLRQAQQRAAPALELAEEAIAEAIAVGEDEALARAYLIADWAHHVMGSPELAVHGQEALAIYERLGDLDGVGNVLNNLGAHAYLDGDWESALDRYTRARDTYLRAGNHVSAAVASTNMGELLVSRGRYDDAEPTLVDAVRVLRTANALDDLLFAEIQIGRLLVERGDAAAAIERLVPLRTEALGVGQTGYAFEAAIHLASALVSCGRAGDALTLLDRAAAEVGEVDGGLLPSVARVRARAEAQRGQRPHSEALIDEGLAVARQHGLPYEEALLLVTRVDLDRRAGRAPDADDLRSARAFFELYGVDSSLLDRVSS